ncbi:hypothetical protein ACFVUW_01520 [Streptomyces xiamenensis]|uniref:hypothetical protein n=1 Tax=Streptomyces xiamenensis TaxID=408015 RepID=UPI0036E0A06C
MRRKAKTRAKAMVRPKRRRPPGQARPVVRAARAEQAAGEAVAAEAGEMEVRAAAGAGAEAPAVRAGDGGAAERPGDASPGAVDAVDAGAGRPAEGGAEGPPARPGGPDAVHEEDGTDVSPTAARAPRGGRRGHGVARMVGVAWLLWFLINARRPLRTRRPGVPVSERLRPVRVPGFRPGRAGRDRSGPGRSAAAARQSAGDPATRPSGSTDGAERTPLAAAAPENGVGAGPQGPAAGCAAGGEGGRAEPTPVPAAEPDGAVCPAPLRPAGRDARGDRGDGAERMPVVAAAPGSGADQGPQRRAARRVGGERAESMPPPAGLPDGEGEATPQRVTDRETAAGDVVPASQEASVRGAVGAEDAVGGRVRPAFCPAEARGSESEVPAADVSGRAPAKGAPGPGRWSALLLRARRLSARAAHAWPFPGPGGRARPVADPAHEPEQGREQVSDAATESVPARRGPEPGVPAGEEGRTRKVPSGSPADPAVAGPSGERPGGTAHGAAEKAGTEPARGREVARHRAGGPPPALPVGLWPARARRAGTAGRRDLGRVVAWARGRRRVPLWWPLALCGVAGALLGGGYGLLADREYAASGYVVVRDAGQGADPAAAVGLAQAFGRIATGDAVLTTAQTDAGVSLDRLRDGVRASTSPDAPMIEITGTAARAGRAAEMANAVARALIAYGNDATDSTGARLTVFAEAQPSAAPVSAAPLVRLAVGLVAGLLVGLLVLLVRTNAGDPPGPVTTVPAQPRDQSGRHDPSEEREPTAPQPRTDRPMSGRP